MLGQGGKEKRSRQRCGTRIGKVRRKTSGPPKTLLESSIWSQLLPARAYSAVQVPQSLSHVRQFWGGYEVVIQVLHHDTGKLEILRHRQHLVPSMLKSQHELLLSQDNLPAYDRCVLGSSLCRAV